MKLPAIFRNYFFYIALCIGVVFIIPYIYLKVNKRSLFVEYVMRFHQKETSAITPDIGNYRPPKPGEFSAADFVHFKLEFYNAQLGALPQFRQRMSHFVFTRYATSDRLIKKFLADPANRRQIDEYLKNNPVWRRKIELALDAARKKKIKLVY